MTRILAPHASVPVVSAVVTWATSALSACAIVAVGSLIDARVAGAIIAPASLFWLLLAGVAAAVTAGIGVLITVLATGRTERALRREIVDVSLGGAAPANVAIDAAVESAPRAARYRAGFVGPIIAALTAPFVVLVVMAVAIDLLTAAALAVLVLVVPVLVGAFQRVVQPVGARSRQTQAALTSSFLAAVGALESLTYLGAARRVGERLARTGEEHRRSLMRVLAANQILIFVVDVGFSLAVVAAAALIAGARESSGAISIGDAVAIVLMSVLVTAPVDVMGQFFYIGIGGRAAQRQLAALVSLPRRASVPTAAGRSDGRIVVDDLTLAWGDAEPIVTGLSFTVERGEVVALVGASGAGKSTVVSAILGRRAVNGGRILVGGGDPLHAPSVAVAVVDQRPHLFHATIAENLRLADPEASDDALWEALDRAGFAGEVRKFPQGLGTIVGDGGSRLSGGQGQRLAIARAWLLDADILILDEPTSRVDLATETVILRSLARLAQGRTVLLVSHRPDTILAADRVVTLELEGASR